VILGSNNTNNVFKNKRNFMLKQTRFKNIVALVICSCSLFILSACQNTYLVQQSALNNYHEFINSGDVLPIQTITDIDGTEIDLQGLGKKKLVIFFATWCSDSNRLLKALNSSPLLDDSHIEIIAIAREEDRETVIAWRDARHIKVPLAVDSDRSLYRKFASGGIPRIVTVGENNKIIQMNLAVGSEQLAKIIW